MPKPSQKLAVNWEKRLSNVAKAEILASVFHLLSDHQPKVWAKVPEWLRAQIRQAMFDCSVDYRDLTKEDITRCVEYCQWLDEQHPQPGSTLDKLLKKRNSGRKSLKLHTK